MRKEINGKFESLEQQEVILGGERVQVYKVQKEQDVSNEKSGQSILEVSALTAFSKGVF